MKLREKQIEILAFRIVKALAEEGLAEIADPAALEVRVAEALTADLSLEDRLNEEVRQILLEHEAMMRSQNIPYQDMFRKVKQKLVRERKLIL
jgi:hypothetical protein